MKLLLAILIAFGALSIIDPALAQEWGDLEGASNFIEWVTGEMMVYVVIIALLGAVIIGLVKWSLEWALGAFLVICILGGIVGQIPGIAEGLVG